MARQRGELVSVGDALSGMDGPVNPHRDVSPQARHHFTQADQVNQLVGASEADPDLGFMARLLALCSLPRTNPGNQHQYKRQNGPFKLIMIAGGDNKLPYGNLPRLLLAWICTEAVRTQKRELVLGKSLAEFMRTLGIYNSGGKPQIRLRNQMKRLFGCTVTLIYEEPAGFARVSSLVADKHEFWWNDRKPAERVLWKSKIELGEKFFQEIIRPPRAARYEHSHGAQALHVGPGSLPVAGLPNLLASRSAPSLLAAGVPPVRSAPHQGERSLYRQELPLQGSARVEEDQDCLAVSKLRDGPRGLDPLALGSCHTAVGSSSASKLGSQVPCAVPRLASDGS